MKHTKGNCQVVNHPESKNMFRVLDKYGLLIATTSNLKGEANANLIAEAFNVANETGLTPRQLLKQRDSMLEALIEISKGKGAYDPDQLKHASNCIDSMTDIAKQAIKEATQ